jgi:predicted DNA-binding transcriptional regulator YafY
MRAGRLILLVRLLQARGRMTASELAGELEVSTRTVLRDVEALNGAGIAIYSVRGPTGGFALLDGSGAAVPSLAATPVGTGTRVTVRISPTGRRMAALLGRPRVTRRRRVDPNRPGWVEATLGVDSIDAAVHELLALGPEVEVRSPGELRHRLRRAATGIATRNPQRGAGRG